MTSPSKISALDFHNRLIADNGIDSATGFSQHGESVRFGVIRRYLEQIWKFPDIKILDYGCADCRLFERLRRGSSPTYMGVDINPKFISHSKKHWKDCVKSGRIKLKVGTVLDAHVFKAIERFEPDAIVASGVFCLKGEAQMFKETIRLLYTLSEVLIFNVLTTEGNNRPLSKPELIPWKVLDVLKVLSYCQCPSWDIIRSYTNNDMTVVMLKSWTNESRYPSA